eukprot:3903142-Pleurochrysis_carterae.AAC.2
MSAVVPAARHKMSLPDELETDPGNENSKLSYSRSCPGPAQRSRGGWSRRRTASTLWRPPRFSRRRKLRALPHKTR